MEDQTHTLKQLFAQLGLPDSPDEIASFIAAHRPLANDVILHEAGFWSPAQRALLAETINDDADWSQVVDVLNNLLRA